MPQPIRSAQHQPPPRGLQGATTFQDTSANRLSQSPYFHRRYLPETGWKSLPGRRARQDFDLADQYGATDSAVREPRRSLGGEGRPSSGRGFGWKGQHQEKSWAEFALRDIG